MVDNDSIPFYKVGLTHVGKVFDAPLAVKENTWLPLTQILMWGIMTWFVGKKRPSRSWGERIAIGGMTTAVMLGSEWCHNLAHAAAAKLVGQPVDAIRIVWGMPILIYFDVNDSTVTPRQHVIRALGGPLFNLLILPVALLGRYLTRDDSPARDVAEAAVGMNTFLLTVSLLPIPGIDGGPILKWSLVEHGRTIEQADAVVRKINLATGLGLGVFSAAVLKKRKYLLGGFAAVMGCVALAVGAGWLKEQ